MVVSTKEDATTGEEFGERFVAFYIFAHTVGELENHSRGREGGVDCVGDGAFGAGAGVDEDVFSVG